MRRVEHGGQSVERQQHIDKEKTKGFLHVIKKKLGVYGMKLEQMEKSKYC